MIQTVIELFIGIVLVIIAAVLPAAIGFGLVKLYRLFNPIDESNLTDIDRIIHDQGDSFAKMILIGWIICGPIYLWVYFTYHF